jgi:hypothetical protein
MTTPYERQQSLIAARLALRPTMRVGDKVRLNDFGIEQVFGTRGGRALSILKTVVHTITKVDPESMTYPEATFVVEVEDPELNEFLLSDACFDPVVA